MTLHCCNSLKTAELLQDAKLFFLTKMLLSPGYMQTYRKQQLLTDKNKNLIRIIILYFPGHHCVISRTFDNPNYFQELSSAVKFERNSSRTFMTISRRCESLTYHTCKCTFMR